MKKQFMLLATLAMATSLWAADDILEIRPCDQYGNSCKDSSGYHQTAIDYFNGGEPFGAGKDIYFNIRLISRENNTSVTKVRSKFQVVYNSESGTAYEQAKNIPFKIGIVARSGQTDWAELVDNTIVRTKSDSKGNYTLNLSDAVFHYRTQPGDFAQPLKLAADLKGTPVGEDESGLGCVFHPTSPWDLYYYTQGGTETNKVTNLLFANYKSRGVTYSDTPDSKEFLNGNYSMSQCGAYVKTVDFKDVARPYKTGTYWKEVPTGSDVKLQLEAVATLSEASTLYVWSQDPSKLNVVNSDGLYIKNVTTETFNVPDAAGKPVSCEVQVAAVEIEGGQTLGKFAVRGLIENAWTNLVLSSRKGYTWTQVGGLVEDFLTVPVMCVKPEPPSLELTRTTPTETDVSVTTDWTKPISQLTLTLKGQTYSNAMTVVIAPVLTRDAALPTNRYARISVEGTPDGWQNDGLLNVTLDAGEETATIDVFGMGAKSGVTDGTSDYVEFRIVDVLEADAKKFLTGGYTSKTYLRFKPNTPTMTKPEAGSTDTATSGIEYQFSIGVEDNWNNRTTTEGAYSVYLAIKREGQAQWDVLDTKNKSWWTCLGTNFVIASDGLLYERKDDGTPDYMSPPAYTFTYSGTTAVSLYIKAPNDETSPSKSITKPTDGRQYTIDVSKPSEVNAKFYSEKNITTEQTEFQEGKKSYGYVKIFLDRKPGQQVYAFLAPREEKYLSYLSGCLTNSTKSVGIPIAATDTESKNFGQLIFLDGEENNALGSEIAFDVILCTTQTYNKDNIFSGYTTGADTPTITVYNQAPTVSWVKMSGKTLPATGSTLVPQSVPKTFTFFVDDASQIDRDATNTVDPVTKEKQQRALMLKYEVYENCDSDYIGGDLTTEGTFYSDVNTTNFVHKFDNIGYARVDIRVMDKDMYADDEYGWSDTISYNIQVTDKPSIGVVGSLGERFDETDTPQMYVRLSEAASTKLDVKLTVTLPKDANPGMLLLEGSGLTKGANNTYTLEIPAGKTQQTGAITVVAADGTKATDALGIIVKAEVTTATTNPSTKEPWKDYYVAEENVFYVENVAPVLNCTIPSGGSYGPLSENAGDQNTKTNGIPVSIGEAPAISWNVSDATNDFKTFTVTWHSPGTGNTYWKQPNVTNQTWYTFTPKFDDPGNYTVTVTMTDKDGGTTSALWWYEVRSSKQLSISAVGPAPGTSAPHVQHYKGSGLGKGHVYVKATVSSSGNWTFDFNCGTVNYIWAYAQGYRAGDVDDGTLGGGKDIKIDKTGKKVEDTEKTPTYYTYDSIYDSFFYCWVKDVYDGGALSSELFGAVAPQAFTNDIAQTYINLPTEKDDEGAYDDSIFEAIFSREWKKSDNIGDINGDGIPDIYAKGYAFDIYDDSGNVTGNDMKDLSKDNTDEDYFPYIFSDVQSTFIPKENTSWVSVKKAFTTLLEIRGWGECLNDAWQQLSDTGKAGNIVEYASDKIYENPNVNTNSTLTELEYDAYVQAGKPEGWSPERPTNPMVDDTDGDGMPDGYEYYIWYKAHVGWFDGNRVHKYLSGRKYRPTDPYNPEVLEPETIASLFDPLVSSGSDWDVRDTDNDGLTDYAESVIGTSPFDFDTDGDGLPDGYEVAITETNPCKYATDDQHADGTLNPDGDCMAVDSEYMQVVGVLGDGNVTEYVCCPSEYEITTTIGTNKMFGTTFYMETTNDNSITRTTYITTKDVETYVDDSGKTCLIGDYPASQTWETRYTTATNGEVVLVRGTATKVSRGTRISGIEKNVEFYNNVAVFPLVCYRAWSYDGGLARGQRLSGLSSEMQVSVAPVGRSVKWLHYHVYQNLGFDPRTGWIQKVYSNVIPVNTVDYQNIDEFLSMVFFYRNGTLTAAQMDPIAQNKTWAQLWTDYTTSPKSADTDGDKMPDGWEFYVMCGSGLKEGVWTRGPAPSDEAGPGSIYSPIHNIYANTTETERDYDSDMLEWPEEYSGTKASARYGWAPVYTAWRNKELPSDPWNMDTDGDGILDGYEGGLIPPNNWWEPVFVKAYAMYGTSGRAGGGLNPLSWDTDGDALPDPWELEYHGTFTAATSGSETYTEVVGATTTTVTRTTSTGVTWNMDGMDATVADQRLDYDYDGLDNWQEYMVGAMRCWRYDDPVSSWGINTMSFTNMPIHDITGESTEWNQFWHDLLLDVCNENGKYNPHLVNGYFDAGVYFSLCKNEWDETAADCYYMFRDGVDHCQANSLDSEADDPRTNPWHYKYKYKFSEDGTRSAPFSTVWYPTCYICCDPRQQDTDGDGMDDYYELFHGMNPLLGSPGITKTWHDGKPRPSDIIFSAYIGYPSTFEREYITDTEAMASSNTVAQSALNNWWVNSVNSHVTQVLKNPELGGYDFQACPWLNGMASVDPDGDNIVNQEESIMPLVQAASTYHHSDPTPLWMTDLSYTNSLTRKYYYVREQPGDENTFAHTFDSDTLTFEWEGVTYNLLDFDGFAESSAGYSYFNYGTYVDGVNNFYSDGQLFSYEENEGFDSDHDYLSDYEEGQGKTKNASDPLVHDDPLRRQAMYFNGTDAFLQTPLAEEQEVPCPTIVAESRQNFLYYTVECWTKADAESLKNDNTLHTLVERVIWADNASSADEKLLRKNFLIGVKNGRWYTCFDSSGTDDQPVEIADGPVASNYWTHVAATYDGTALRLYVNGVCNNIHATSIQPEHGIAALATENDGTINKSGGTTRHSEYISILVGASAATKHGIVFDWAWRNRAYTNVTPDNPLGLDEQTTLKDYENFFKGYIDEVRIWDGARTAADIQSDYENRTRYTFALAAENRESVYSSWQAGARRSPEVETQLPAQLMYHWAFDHIPGAIVTNDVIVVPAGFDTDKAVLNAKARWSRPDDYVETRWASSEVHSTVYNDYAWVPWINNTVSHLPRYDLTTVDSFYWSEDYAGATSVSDYGYDAFAFPRTAEVYSRWSQLKYTAHYFYDNHFDKNFTIWNNGASAYTSDTGSQSWTTKTRYYAITDYTGGFVANNIVSVTNDTSSVDWWNLVQAMCFAARDRNVVGDDILPMGGAYPRRISLEEGGMWDNKNGENPQASDAWAQTGEDADNNGLPDWWEEYARINYCQGLSPKDPLLWDTTVTYKNGVKMPAYQAYLRDLAEGMIKNGDEITYDANYVDTRDTDEDGLPDWWEELYKLDTSVNNANDDPDNDGLSNYQEYILSHVYLLPNSQGGYAEQLKAHGVDTTKFSLNPTLAYSSSDYAVPDYFRRYTDLFFDITNSPSHFYSNEYFGNEATDHDFMEDPWEGQFATTYSNPKRYDPLTDTDGDGWSTYAECRASLWYNYFAASLIDQWTGAENNQYVPCYPQPIIGVKATYYGVQDISGKPLVIRTTSGQRARVDATFVIPPSLSSQTRYLGSFESDTTLHGHLSPGMIDANSIAFEYANVDEEKVYEWNWNWYDSHGITHPEITSGTFATYQYYYARYNHIEYEGSDFDWHILSLPIGSGDGTMATLYDAGFTTKYGTINCTTGEYELNLATAAKTTAGKYVFRVTYESRLGHEWPQTVYVSDTKELQVTTSGTDASTGDGYVREGANTIEAFIDLDASGTYTVGEPYGVVQNVDVGWHKVPVTTIELKDESHVVARTDIGSTGKQEGSTELTKTVAIRRTKINDETLAASRVVASQTLTLDSRSYLTEADVLSSVSFDLDSRFLVSDAESELGLVRTAITSATYEIYESKGTSNVLLKTFTNTFNPRRTKPAPVSPVQSSPVYTSAPVFSFTCSDETMTAYELQVQRKDGTLVYDSGITLLPGRTGTTVGTSAYAVTAPIYADARVCAGTTTTETFTDSTEYQWRVALFNAKYNDIEDGEGWSDWADFQLDVKNKNRYPGMSTGNGRVSVAVRYFGTGYGVDGKPNTENLTAGQVWIEAFENADFHGTPVARLTLANLNKLNNNTVVDDTDVTLRGLVPGNYYLRAFIDFNSNGERDDWESWGYVNYVGKGMTAIYNPKTIEVASSADIAATPDKANCTIFIEDCDTNQNEIPDSTETFVSVDFDDDGIADTKEAAYGTDAALWDTDGDSMPDGWEVYAGSNPKLPDAGEAKVGDVMAFAKIAARFITVDAKRYMLPTDAPILKAGDKVTGLEVYTTYTYPVYEDGNIVEYLGVGGKTTLTTASTITAVETDGTAVLVHAQVYDYFGYDSTTATTAENAANTKAFTALDKYLVVRYLEALDLAKETEVNQKGLWKYYTLKPYDSDCDKDGIADGWELYVMFGPDGAGSAKPLYVEDKTTKTLKPNDAIVIVSPWVKEDALKDSPDSKNASVKIRLIDEYDGGVSPTDPWNMDTDGDSVLDAYAYQYHLKGGLSGKDNDGDGLSNYAEYLISKVFKFAELDPDNAKTDGSCVDYFRTYGNLYFGEMFTDHDQVADAWEDEHDAYATSGVYDPARDDDKDGWSNFAEAKVGTNPGAAQTVGVDDEVLPEYPIPAIAAKVVYNGKSKLSAPIIFQAWSETTDSDMVGVPDGAWRASADAGGTNVTKYIGLNPGTVRTYYLGTGVLKPGTLLVKFRDLAYEKAALVDNTEESSFAGEIGNARWYYFVQDDGTGTLKTSITNQTPVAVGTVDYATGRVTIDFGSAALQGIAYERSINGTGENTDEKSVTGYSNYDKLDLSRSYVKLEWQPEMIDTAGNATYYLSDCTSEVLSKGHIREGKNKFVVFSDTDESGTYTPGEPFGFVGGVDVGWQGGAFTVELTETSPIFARVVFATAGDTTDTDTDTTADSTTYATDREAMQADNSGIIDLSDKKTLQTELGDVSIYGSEGTTSASRILRVRVLRALVDGKTTLGKYKSGEDEASDRRVEQTVVMDKYFDLGVRNYLHEGDFLGEGVYDIDWVNLNAGVFGQRVYESESCTGVEKLIDATNVTYMIRLGEDTSNLVFRCLINRNFDTMASRTKGYLKPVSVGDMGTVHSATPVFRWAMADVNGAQMNSYTAFRLQVREADGTVVYESGYRRAPARGTDGYYEWQLTDPIGSTIKPGANYTWRVAMFNAKFSNDTFWEKKDSTVATWSDDAIFTVAVNTQQAMNDHGYSTIAATVKYTGPSDVSSAGVVYVQAFTTADFAGDPVGEIVLTDKNELRNTSHVVANAYLPGLPETGTYYVRAFIDLNGNGVKDDFESWGAADASVTLATTVVTPPTVGLYIEDADTDGDWIPDAYEYVKAGNLDDYTSSVIGGDTIRFIGTIDTSVGSAGISTGLTGASLTIFQNQALIKMLMDNLYKTGSNVSIDDIRKAVEKKVNPTSVTITALTLAPDGKTITLALDAEVTDSIAGTLLGKVYDLSNVAARTATVTVKVYAKPTLATVEWKLVSTKDVTFGVDQPQVTVGVDGVNMSSGFYKVEVTETK